MQEVSDVRANTKQLMMEDARLQQQIAEQEVQLQHLDLEREQLDYQADMTDLPPILQSAEWVPGLR